MRRSLPRTCPEKDSRRQRHQTHDRGAEQSRSKGEEKRSEIDSVIHPPMLSRVFPPKTSSLPAISHPDLPAAYFA